MVVLMNLMHKLFAVLFSFLMLVTGAVNAPFNGDVRPWQSEDGVVLAETLLRAQGVTTDGKSWIFSGRSSLEKTDVITGEITALNLRAIPEELKRDFGAAHIGGISCANGVIYAGVEDSKVWQHPLVVLYRADTLEYTGTFFELPTENHTSGVPWVIADGEHGLLYAGDAANSDALFVYALADMTYLRTLALQTPVSEIQGGELYNGTLYLGTNDATRAVYAVDAQTGETRKLFDRIAYRYKYIDNFGGEGEDLTVLPLPDGTFLHTLQIGATFTDATLRHYALTE